MVPDVISSNIPALPLDWVVVGLCALFITIYTLRMGVRLALALSLTMPVVVFTLTSIPTTLGLSKLVTLTESAPTELMLAIAVFVFIFFMVFRMLGDNFIGSAFPLSALCIGIATTALMIVFANEMLGSNPLWHFGPSVQLIFGSTYKLWWVIASYGALAFFRRG